MVSGTVVGHYLRHWEYLDDLNPKRLWRIWIWNELIKHLDYIQGQLDQGLGYSKLYKSGTGEGDINTRKRESRSLKDVLPKADKCQEHGFFTFFKPLLSLV